MLISRSYLNRRRGMAAIVIAALVLLLSGCRTEGTPEPGAETATPSRTAASTATVTPSASPTADVNATATAIQREENEQALFENAEAEIRDVLMWLPPQFDPSLTDASGTALARLFAEIVENHAPNQGHLWERLADQHADGRDLRRPKRASGADDP